MSIENIAKICHETNRAYCETIGDFSQSTWDEASAWQKSSVINGVQFHLQNPNISAEQSHEEWLREKKANGWQYGPIKDVFHKKHPCFVSYDKLPEEQRIKDKLFKSIVDVFYLES